MNKCLHCLEVKMKTYKNKYYKNKYHKNKCNRNTLTAFVLMLALAMMTIYFFIQTDTRSRAEDSKNVYYTYVKIEYGDTLDTIYEKYNTDKEITKTEYKKTIMKINGMYSENIYPGLFLTIAVYY